MKFFKVKYKTYAIWNNTFLSEEICGVMSKSKEKATQDFLGTFINNDSYRREIMSVKEYRPRKTRRFGI